MATSFVLYPGQTGSTTDYAVGFEYLSEDYVLATVDGVSASFTFLSTYLIRFDTAPDGDLKIYRSTPRTPVNTYTNGSILVDDDINASFLQSLHISEEVSDAAMQNVSDGTWDATDARIKNVADPVDDQDAATKVWVETTYASSVAAAASSASAAAASATAADASADAAAASAAAALASEVAAELAETNAEAAQAAAEAAAATTTPVETQITAATTDSTPADADVFGYVVGGALRKLTWANIKTALNSVYQPLSAVLTATTASFTTADETKLDAVGTMANRAFTVSTSDPSGGSDGDIWFKVS